MDLQRTFVILSESRRQDFMSGMFSSHPPSAERVRNNIADAVTLPKGGEVGKERYQSMILQLIETKPAYDAYEEAQKAFVDGNCNIMLFPGYAVNFLEVVGSIYPGYHPGTGISSAFIGSLYGVVDAGIAATIFAWLYNYFCRIRAQ